MAALSWIADVAGMGLRKRPEPQIAPRPARELRVVLTPAQKAMRIRDRYIAVRFPGFPRNGRDLADVPAVLKAAAIYFNDGRHALAKELLAIASESHDGAEALWLARLELAFLMRDTEGFRESARRFRARHPASDAWPTLVALGWELGILHACRPEMPGSPLATDSRVDLPGWLPHPDARAAQFRVCMMSLPAPAPASVTEAA